MLIPTIQETSTNAGPQREMCLHCFMHRSAGTLHIVYCRIVYYKGRVYGYDRSYEGGNLPPRVA